MVEKLTRFQRDTLKEVASIGANSASTALSKLTNKFILVGMKKLRRISINDVPELFKKDKDDVVCVLFTFTGDASGTMLCLSTKKVGLAISNLVLGKNNGASKEFNNKTEDAIKEVGNILVGVYLAALTDMSGLNMIESKPYLIVDIINIILKKALKTLKDNVEDVIVIETSLLIEKKKFTEELILMLTPEMLNKLFTHLFKELK